MYATHQIQEQRRQIIEELVKLTHVRRGSITNQVVQFTDRNGKLRQRGPYPIYTYKDNGKTVSRRLTAPEQAEIYRRHIQDGRRFNELVEQLRRLGEELCEHQIHAEAEKKTSKRKSSKSLKHIDSPNA